MKAGFPTAFPTTGLVADRVRSPAFTDPRSRYSVRSRHGRTTGSEPCGGESVIDFALCLIPAVTVIGLLLLAL